LSCAGGAEQPDAPEWRVSGSTTWSATDIIFSGDVEAPLRRQSASLSLEYRISEDFTLTGGGGASLLGDVNFEAVRYDLKPGPVGVVGAAYRILDGTGWEPFLLFGAAFSASTAQTESSLDSSLARMSAFDFRASLIAGEVFLNAVAPYLAIRGFGGPVVWKGGLLDTRGTDKYHFQVGGGMLVTAGWLDAYFEVIPLGERAATFGVATSF
jgi:hypothetical protein